MNHVSAFCLCDGERESCFVFFYSKDGMKGDRHTHLHTHTHTSHVETIDVDVLSSGIESFFFSLSLSKITTTKQDSKQYTHIVRFAF